MLSCEYDPEANALYASFCTKHQENHPDYGVGYMPDRPIAETVPYNDQVLADVDKDGVIVGIEVLGVVGLFPSKNPSEVTETDIRALVATAILEHQLDKEDALSDSEDSE